MVVSSYQVLVRLGFKGSDVMRRVGGLKERGCIRQGRKYRMNKWSRALESSASADAKLVACRAARRHGIGDQFHQFLQIVIQSKTRSRSVGAEDRTPGSGTWPISLHFCPLRQCQLLCFAFWNRQKGTPYCMWQTSSGHQ
jgi:hypothetical protein